MQTVENTRIALNFDNNQACLNDYDYSTFKLRKNPALEFKYRAETVFYPQVQEA